MGSSNVLARLVENAVKGVVMVFPTVGYVDTLRLMRNSKSAAAYNFNTVQIINIAQGTKVIYYVYRPYSTTIFGQSLSLLVAATMLTFLRFQYEHYPAESRPSMTTRILNMAQNCCFLDYVLSLFVYVSITVAGMVILRSFVGDAAVELLGLFSNLAEATTSFPMFVRIVVMRNVKDVSPVLVLQYLFGDIFKFVLYMIARAPWSFFFGAVCQFVVDVITTVVFTKHMLCDKPVEDEEELLESKSDAV